MANPQQLDVVKPGEVEDAITGLMTRGLLGGAPVPTDGALVDPSMLDHDVPRSATPADGMSAEAFSHGATVISGPEEGGALLERPVGSFLAEHAADRSIELDPNAGESGATYLARRIAGAGEMTVAGMDVNLIDFVPGGDIVQMVAGERFNPSSMMLAIAKGKMESEAIHGHLLHRETEQERAAEDARLASSPSINDRLTSSPSTDDRHVAHAGQHRHGDVGTGHGEKERTTGDGTGPATDEALPARDEDEQDRAPGTEPGPDRKGRPRIDADTAARDLAILGQEHARNLDNAVSQWDEHDVHTEMTLHGRRIEVDTHFDAHNVDNAKERDTARDHAGRIPGSQDNETVTEGSKMAFRSQVHAHLEAASRDEGISR